MKTNTLCPCCSELMLRHTKHGSIYWFCPHCWQEMPDLQAENSQRQTSKVQR